MNRCIQTYFDFSHPKASKFVFDILKWDFISHSKKTLSGHFLKIPYLLPVLS